MSFHRGMDKEDVIDIYIYMIEYYSGMKKNKTMPFVPTQLQLEIIIQSEINQTERQISYDITYTWNLKKMIQK